MMVVAGLYSVTQEFTDALEERGHANAERLRTQVMVLNDPVAMPYDNVTGELHVYIKNIGSREMNHRAIVILIDGPAYMPTNITILNATGWFPGVTVDATVLVTLETGDHDLKVIAEYGSSDRLSFRV
ncbi:MAG: hypothetical protein L0Z54_02340 [Thermoplasmata archaeon]|nr:hypothetical protein [Thermoplasmata archaeon]